MERLRALIADAVQYVQNASPRERRLLLFAGGGVVAFLLLVLWVGFGSSIRRHETALDEKRSEFFQSARDALLCGLFTRTESFTNSFEILVLEVTGKNGIAVFFIQL